MQVMPIGQSIFSINIHVDRLIASPLVSSKGDVHRLFRGCFPGSTSYKLIRSC